MTSTEEQAVARALHTLVSDSVAPLDMADRVERRYRRHRVAAATGLFAALVATVLAIALVPTWLTRWNSPEGRLPTNATTSNPAVAIRDGRFVRPLVLDSGALRVDAPRGKPDTGERDAVATFRSTGYAYTEVGDVLIGYGLVTIRPTVLTNLNSGLVFDRRPAWLVFYRGGAHSCGAIRSPAVTGVPEGRPVFVLADSGLDAVAYVGRGSFCGQPPTGPVARLAYRHVSVPWQEVQRSATKVTVRYQAPACGQLEAGTMTTDPGSAPTLTLVAAQPLASLPCPKPAAAETQVPAPRGGESLQHGPTGPLTGYVTAVGPPPRFDYSHD